MSYVNKYIWLLIAIIASVGTLGLGVVFLKAQDIPFVSDTFISKEGIDFFIGACHIQEDNAAMYYSARFECETSAFPYNDHFFKRKVLISGNYPNRTLYRSEADYPKSSPYQPGGSISPNAKVIVLLRDGVDIGVTSVEWTTNSREAMIDTVLRNVPRIYSFGRIKGFQTSIDTSFLACASKSDNYYNFSQEGISLFYKHVFYQRILGITLHQYVRDEKYDGHAVAKVIECKTWKGIVYQECWIDPSRGYVCPIVRCYDKKNGKIKDEYIASNFFRDPISGLWFPAYYEETHFDGETDEVLSKHICKVDPASFRLNQKISDEEFAIDIPESALISDRKIEGATKVYQALQSGTISLAEGGLDLEKMDWLEDVTPFRPEDVEKIMQTYQDNSIGPYRLMSIIAGIAVILLALLSQFLKKLFNK